MDKENMVVKISVRNLVEFIFRTGDITPATSGVKNTDAMQEGSRIHRKIQKSMGLGYEAEVSLFTIKTLTSEESGDKFDLIIEGRADGIIHDKGNVIVDEIKGVFLDVNEMKEPFFVHKAQAMCYAYMICENENLTQIEVQLTYCNMETEQIVRFNEVFDRSEITTWFTDLIDAYKKWAIYEYDWAKKRNSSIKKLDFPFEYRKGQKALAAMTYKTIESEKKLFIEAPTGVGKTITTVFPSIKAIGEGISNRIFYLTAKTITRTVAEDCFNLLCNNNLCFKPLTITAKEKVCVLEKMACNPNDCPYAKGHYDRINEAVYDILTHEDRLNNDTIITYANKHQVCPFEFTLDAALFADAVICDYNYVFDPNIYLKRFFSDTKKGQMVFLVDEAHNLVERAREMYSASIIKEDFLAVKRIVKHILDHEKRPENAYTLRQFISSLENANKTLLNFKHDCDEFTVIEDVGILAFQLLRILSIYETFSKEYMSGYSKPVPGIDQDDFDKEKVLDFFFSVRNFSMLLDAIDDNYRIYLSYTEDNEFKVTLQCMDPANRLSEVFSRGKSAILFSATMLPINYYKGQLAGKADDNAVYAESIFNASQRKLMIAQDVTSKYTRRGPKEYIKIADYIEKFVDAKHGNYMIFFPSYSFMDNVIMRLNLSENQELLVQSSDMRESEKEEFLNSFAENSEKSIIGCCVMGGIFSEGIDLVGDRLIGAVIVGTGLPMVCNERELFKDYFDEKKGSGFDYAYLYPGVNKVFQAGGRVIRTAEDKGAILLLDERFLQRQYLNLFPREWFPYDVVNVDSMKKILDDFWN